MISNFQSALKTVSSSRVQWLKAVILAVWETEEKRITV
jgi:hypothetical protein